MTYNELKEKIIHLYSKKTGIPKPESWEFFITKIGTTKIDGKQKEGFQYAFSKKYKKYVPFETLYACYEQLTTNKILTRDWFKKTFPQEHKSRPCNFTTIGGIFVELRLAEYKGDGEYKKS